MFINLLNPFFLDLILKRGTDEFCVCQIRPQILQFRPISQLTNLWLGYCAFHAGEYKKSLEVFFLKLFLFVILHFSL